MRRIAPDGISGIDAAANSGNAEEFER